MARSVLPKVLALVLGIGPSPGQAADVGTFPGMARSASPGFVANVGQVPGPARFVAAGSGNAVYFEPGSVMIDHRPDAPGDRGVVLRMTFPAAECPPVLEPRDRRESGLNVFLGNRPARWRAGVASYREMHYPGIAPGADLVYRMENGRLKYDVVLLPGADLARAVLRYEGAEALAIDRDGGLVVRTDGGELRDAPPVLFQMVEGRRVEVPGGYRVVSRDVVGFWAGEYDRERPLIVDPDMTWSTFLGGGLDDYPYRVTTDGQGDIYVVGITTSTDYPVTTGAYQRVKGQSRDVFVTKLRGDGTGLVWSTFLGGALDDNGTGIAVDANRNVYVTGNTASTDFPVTTGALRTTHAGGGTDGFVAKLSSTGAGLTYSTYLGGAGTEMPLAVAVDASGYATVAGYTASTNFPTTPGVVKATRASDQADGFVSKLNLTGSQLVYSTFVGTDGSTDEVHGLALDGLGRATVAGNTMSAAFPVTSGAFDGVYNAWWEGFVARLNETGTAYVYSSYLSGSGYDLVSCVALDTGGNAYVVGRTASTDFPTTTGAYQRVKGGGTYDGFVAKVSPDGRTLVYGTYLGGSGEEFLYGVVVSPSNEAIVTGYTDATGFPVTAGAYDGTFNGGYDSFVTRIAAGGGSLNYSTWLGGTGGDIARSIALRPDGQVVAVGYTTSSSYPTTPGSFDRVLEGGGVFYDGFVSVLEAGGSSNVGVEGPGASASRVWMSAPSPNPSRDRSEFDVSLREEAVVVIRVVDLGGRLVRRLHDGTLAAGAHRLAWDGRDLSGRDAGPGVFFVEVLAPGGRAAARVVRLQ